MHDEKSFQDSYPEDVSHCYGCGRLNPHGLQIKSHWDGEDGVAVFTPKPYHMAFPGFVYGGLIASLIDCHCIGTAAAAASREAGQQGDGPLEHRYVTASLHIDYLHPTPLGPELTIRAVVEEIKGKKTILSASLSANGQVCATGRVVAVRLPEQMRQTSP